MDILDDMLAGIGWSMQEYLKHGENDYYPPLPNGHRLFLHDIRRVAVRCAVAMGEEGDMVVSAYAHFATTCFEDLWTDDSVFFNEKLNCPLEIILTVILFLFCLLNILYTSGGCW